MQISNTKKDQMDELTFQPMNGTLLLRIYNTNFYEEQDLTVISRNRLCEGDQSVSTN